MGWRHTAILKGVFPRCSKTLACPRTGPSPETRHRQTKILRRRQPLQFIHQIDMPFPTPTLRTASQSDARRIIAVTCMMPACTCRILANGEASDPVVRERERERERESGKEEERRTIEAAADNQEMMAIELLASRGHNASRLRSPPGTDLHDRLRSPRAHHGFVFLRVAGLTFVPHFHALP